MIIHSATPVTYAIIVTDLGHYRVWKNGSIDHWRNGDWDDLEIDQLSPEDEKSIREIGLETIKEKS